MNDDKLRDGSTTARRQPRPRIPAIIALVFGVIVAIVAIASLTGAFTDGTMLGIGLLAAAVSVAALLLARYGFRLAGSSSETAPRVGVLMLLVAVVFFLGVLGSMAAFVISSAMISHQGAATALILLVLSGVLTVTGARVLGITAARARDRGVS